MSVLPDKLSVNRAAFSATVPLVAEFSPVNESRTGAWFLLAGLCTNLDVGAATAIAFVVP
jgi:hypothetical protein